MPIWSRFRRRSFSITISSTAPAWIYKGPALAKSFTPVSGFYGYQSRTAQIAAFIDSAGHAIRTEVWQSSGVPGIDATALAEVQGSTYEPAQFLCTPVVSIAIFPITYEVR
jgi:hypothetical protein